MTKDTWHNNYSLTYSMEQGPSGEATGSAVSQEIPRFFRTRRFITVLTSARYLSQLHPVPTTSSHFLKIHLNIILPSMSGSPQWYLSPPKPCAPLSPPPYAPHAPPISFFSILPPAQYSVRSTDHLSDITYEGWNFNSGNYLFTTDTK